MTNKKPVREYDFGHDGVGLVKTCSACPEQYDAYYKGAPAGYLRLRWGHFDVTCPGVVGDTVYEAEVGDGAWTGAFLEEEREGHLKAACEAIKKWSNEHEQ